MANTLELFIKAKDLASRDIKTVEKNVGELGNTSDNAAKKMASLFPAGRALQIAGAAAAAAATALTGAALRAASVGDRFDKMSQRVGVASSDLSQLAFVASQSGTNIQTVENSLRILGTQMDNAASGSKTAAEGFDELGINVKNADGSLRDKMSILKEAADKMSKMDNETKKAALAGKIFGERYGSQLMPMLNQGSEGIEKLMARANELGMTVDDVAAKDAANFTDAMDEATTAIDGVVKTVGKELIPIMTPFIKKFADAVTTTIDFVEESHALKDALLAVKTAICINKTAQDIYADSVKVHTDAELKSILKIKKAEIEALEERRLKGGQFRTEKERAKHEELQNDVKIFQAEIKARKEAGDKTEAEEKRREEARKKRSAQRKEDKEKEEEEEFDADDMTLALMKSKEVNLDEHLKKQAEKRKAHREELRAAEEEFEAEKAEKDAQALEAQKMLKDAETAVALNALGDVSQAIKAFGGQNSAAYKSLASMQVIVSTASAVMAALAPPPIGFGPVAGIFKAGVIGAMGLAQIAKINGAKFHDGGLVPGAGEVPAVLQSGEFVINRAATQRAGIENLQAINEGRAGAGVNVVNFIDTDQLDNYLSSRKGQKAVLNSIELD